MKCQYEYMMLNSSSGSSHSFLVDLMLEYLVMWFWYRFWWELLIYDAGAKMAPLKKKKNGNDHSQQICRLLPLGYGLTDYSHFGPFFIFKNLPTWHIYLLFSPFWWIVSKCFLGKFRVLRNHYFMNEWRLDHDSDSCSRSASQDEESGW